MWSTSAQHWVERSVTLINGRPLTCQFRSSKRCRSFGHIPWGHLEDANNNAAGKERGKDVVHVQNKQLMVHRVKFPHSREATPV